MEKQRKTVKQFFLQAYRKIRKFIHRPWFYDKRFLITLSVVCSVMLWAVLATNVSPVETKVIQGVHITINEESIEENFGLKFVEVISPESLKDQEFDIRVSGRKYLLTQLTAKDFTAVATPSKSVSKPGAYDFTVTVSCNNPLLDVTVLGGASQMYVRFDRFVPIELNVSSVEGVGATVAANSGLIMGTQSTNVAKVRVYGPENEIQQIASVKIRAEVNKELTDGESFPGTEVFLNEQGEELTLSSNAVITRYAADGSTVETVKVTIPIKTSKVFNVDVKMKNVPSNVSVSKLPITISPRTVTLVGSPDAINNFTETYGDTFSAGEIDLTQLDNQINTFYFDLSLSTGIEAADSVERIKVKLDLSKYSVEKFNVNAQHSKFDIVNYTGTRNVRLKTTSLSNIRIIGPAHAVSQIRSGDITVEADMTGKETVTGSCTVNAVITVKNHANCWAVGTYEIETVIE